MPSMAPKKETHIANIVVMNIDDVFIDRESFKNTKKKTLIITLRNGFFQSELIKFEKL